VVKYDDRQKTEPTGQYLFCARAWVFVCVWESMFVCMFVCVCVCRCEFVCGHVYVNEYVYVCVYVCAFVLALCFCVIIFECMCACQCVCVCVSLRVCVRVCLSVYIFACLYGHTLNFDIWLDRTYYETQHTHTTWHRPRTLQPLFSYGKFLARICRPIHVRHEDILWPAQELFLGCEKMKSSRNRRRGKKWEGTSSMNKKKK